MRYLIVFLTIISTINLFSEDYKLWERQFSVEGGLRNAEFAGANDEFIVGFDNHHLYRFDTESSQMLDSIYYEKDVYSCITSNDGLIFYTAIEDKILLYDVYTMKAIDTILSPTISDEAPNNNVRIALTKLNISDNDKLLTFRYGEFFHNDYKHFEFVIYDLENKRVIAREGDVSRGYQSMFYNPTFTPDGEMLLVIVDRPSTDFNEEERQVWFYDISEQKFITIGLKDQFKNKIETFSKFTFINNSEVHITNSVLPDLYGFNILNLETGHIESIFDFKDLKNRRFVGEINKINDELYLLALSDFNTFQVQLVFFDIFKKDTLTTFVFDRLANLIVKVNRDNSLFLGYGSYNLELYNLSEYLKIADVKSVNLISETNVFPNPSNSRSYTLRMNLLSNINASINLYNTVGQKVLTIKENIFLHIGENIVDFNIPLELPSGQYFLRIESERGSQDVTIQL